jgi:catechol 2,3-dioxygenase-like lactoylglutathione lyase family enzyme
MSGPVRVWYATVYVREFERALRFYRDKLGLPLRFADERFGFASFATPGAGFTVARVAADDPEQEKLLGRHTGIAIGVTPEDVRGLARARRVRRFRPRSSPGGTLAQLADPEGNLLTLDQYRQE